MRCVAITATSIVCECVYLMIQNVQRQLNQPDQHHSERCQHVRNPEVTGGLSPQLIEREAFRNISQGQLACNTVDLEHRQVRDDHADRTCASEGKSALADDLGRAVLGHVLHRRNDLGLVRVRDEIHGTTDTCVVVSVTAISQVWMEGVDSPLTSLPGIMKLAISPACDTCIA